MNKKLLALAVAAAIAPAAAMADSGNVTISGGMHFSLDSLNGKNAAGTDNTRQTNVSSNTSNIKFGGNEDLGNGLSAVWQVQTYFSAGGTGSADAGVLNENVLGGVDGVGVGNTYLGLSSKTAGTVLLGKHESPMKLVGRKADLFGDQIGDNRNITSKSLTSGTALAGGGLTVGYDLRPNNVIAYITPTVSGLHGAIAYVSNVGSTSAWSGTTPATPGATTDKSVTAWSAAGFYDNGPLFVGLGYEKHNWSRSGDALITGMKDSHAWRLSAGYSFGDAKVVALYQRESDLAYSTTVLDADRTVWGLGASYKFGNNVAKLQYYRSGQVKDIADTEANMWALGVDHNFSKRTTGYVAYAQTNNDASAKYSAFGGGHGDNPGTATGKDPSGWSIGMKHSF